MSKVLVEQAEQLLEKCRNLGIRLATAESCTGGLIAATFTEIPGSSDVFDRGFITYSNQAKSEMLAIAPEIITQNGAVSEIVARHMALGALKQSGCDIAVAVTGIAGPDGGSTEKPLGLVHIAVAGSNGNNSHEKCLFGKVSRSEIRNKTVLYCLKMIDDMVSKPISA